MKIRRFLLILCAVTLLGGACLSASQLLWDTDGVPIRQGNHIWWTGNSVELGDGSVLAVWSDTRCGYRYLYARAFNEEGNLWDEDIKLGRQISWGDNSRTGDKETLCPHWPTVQDSPALLRLATGNVLVAWLDADYTYYNGEIGKINIHKISPQGELLWGDEPVAINSEAFQYSLRLFSTDEAGIFVTWLDRRERNQVFGKYLNNEGEPYSQEWDIEGGIQFTDIQDSVLRYSAVTDGDDGIVISCIGYCFEERVHHILLKRISSTAEILWERIIVGELEMYQLYSGLARNNDGIFSLLYTDRSDGYDKLFMQAVDIYGDDIWEEPLPLDPESIGQPYHHYDPKVLASTDNDFVVTWGDARDGSTDLYAQKIDVEGNRLWQERGLPIAVGDYDRTNAVMQSDGEERILIAWEDMREGGHPNVDIYLQHISYEGEVSYQENGLPLVVNQGEAFDPSFIRAGDKLYASWADERDGSVSIYYQIYDDEMNELQPENGKMLHEGISESVDSHNIVSNGEYAYIVWTDQRTRYLGYRIMVQKIDKDGNLLFEENGIFVTEHTGAYQLSGTGQRHISVVPHHSGGIALAWVEQRANHALVYAQAIGPNGERLWDPEGTGLGIRVSATDDVYTQDNPIISRRGEAYIIVYDETDPGEDFSYQRDTRAQKIINGEKQWGEEGVTIAWQIGEYVSDNVVQEVINGEYILWRRSGQYGWDDSIFYLKRIDENGNAAAGWDEYGEVVVDYPDFRQLRPQAVLTGEGVLVIWEDRRHTEGLPRQSSLYGQLISPQGEIMWEENGIPLADYDNDQVLVSLSYHENGYAYFAFRDGRYEPRSRDVSFQKIDMQGNLLWGDPAPFAAKQRTEHDFPVLSLVDDKVLLLWENNYGEEGVDLHMQIASIEDGRTYWGPEGSPMIVKNCRQVRARVIPFVDNSALVIWLDGRSSDIAEISNLYAQRIDMNVDLSVGEDEIAETMPAMQLHPNYPNPFNPDTNISFDLKRDKQVSLEVYNIKGQSVASLLDKEHLEQGRHTIVWNGLNCQGREVGSGVYFYRLTGAEQTLVRKMVLIR